MKITTENLYMAESYISMRAFAKMAGVSAATVSHVYSNPSSVSDATVKRVLALAEAVGFSPSAVAKAAFGESTKSVGILLPSLSDSYFGGIARAIQKTLIQEDYLPIFLASVESPEDALRRLLKHKVDALVIGCSEENLRIPKFCRTQMNRLPIVALEQVRPGLWSDSVLNDDYDGGLQAGKHLIDLGHRRFGACTYGEDRSNCVPRIAGFRDAIRLGGGMLEERFIVHLDSRGSDKEGDAEMQNRLETILSGPDAPSAIFATTDFLALHVYKAAEKAGLRIPEDLSVIGFGDLQFSDYIDPSLTTIRQNPAVLGTRTVELLLKRLADPERKIETIRVPVQLQVRGSTAKEKSWK